MTLVRHLLTDDANEPTRGFITATLQGAGLRRTTQSQVVAAKAVEVGPDGLWSRDLVPNGPGEFYRVAVQSADARVQTMDIVVPDSTSPQWLGDLIVDAPLPTGHPLAGLLRGESAYEIAVRNGFVGTEVQWLASLRGTGGGSAAGLADGSVTAAKLAFDVATQAELDALAESTAATLRTKVNSSTYVAGVEAGAQRANHTGTQRASTISDFQPVVEAIIRDYLAANGGNTGGGGTTPSPTTSYLLTENGDTLTTESGDRLVLA